MPAFSQTDQAKPVFDLDCINFAGRGLGKAPPKKKKAHPGLAMDGTTWEAAPDGKKVVVAKIFPGESAEKAGIAPGDQIISVNGYPTENASLRDLFCAYHMYKPDSMIETLIIRKNDGTEQTHKLQLLPADKCNAEEKAAWVKLYSTLGY